MCFAVQYIDRGHGWYDIILTYRDETLLIPVSDAFDPFDDSDEWLKKIASGAVNSVMSINPEGPLVYLEYKVSGASGQLIVTWDTPEKEVLLSAEVASDVLVKAFREHFGEFEYCPDLARDREAEALIQEVVDEGFLKQVYPPPA